MDDSTTRKTAEKFLEMLEMVKEELERDWGVSIAAVVTDGSGEAKKARTLFARKYPNILTLHCFAHQVRIQTIY